MINVVAVGSDFRCDHDPPLRQKLIVARRNTLARLGPCRQMRQFDIQDRGLQSIHAAVDAFHDVIVFSAVPGECGHPIGQLIVIGHDAARIAVGAEVFSWIKRKGRGVCQRFRRTCPLYLARWAWAQSSITQRLCFFAMAMIASMSAGCP